MNALIIPQPVTSANTPVGGPVRNALTIPPPVVPTGSAYGDDYGRDYDQMFKDAFSKELAFRKWYKQHADRWLLNPDPDDPSHFYDYRAAYRAGIGPDPFGHWPSRFKLDGHPRMYLEGVNTRTGEQP